MDLIKIAVIRRLFGGSGGGGADGISPEDIPGYVKAEALSLAANVQKKRAENSITFIVGTDAHQWDPDNNDCDTAAKKASAENIVAGNRHAGMAMKALAYMLDVDFAAYLGDSTAGSSATALNEGEKHIKEINEDIAEAFRGLPNFRTAGNHDPLTYSVEKNNDYLSEEDLFPLIGAFNEIDNETVHGDTTAGYCYRDFPAKKVRVICLNTAQNTGKPPENLTSENVTNAQIEWFAETLYNVGSKTDAADWSVIILSHHPIDYKSTNISKVRELGMVLGAYIRGGAIHFDDKDVYFEEHNGAAIVGNFHGHTHCYNVSQLNPAPGVEDRLPAYRIAVPNMCFYRNNEYGSVNHDYDYGEVDTYDKSPASGSDTAFCVVTVDLTNKVVYAFHYGAGPAANDKCRILTYDFGDTYYNVNKTLVKITTDGLDFAKEGASYTAHLSPLAGYTVKSVKVKMGGADITAAAYDDTTDTITVAEVTGKIDITATPYTNLVPDSVDASGNPYNTVGYKNNTRMNSGGGETAKNNCIASGFMPYDGSSVVRMAFMVGPHRYGDEGNYFCFYDSGKTLISARAGNSAGYRVEGKVLAFDPSKQSVDLSNAEWIRCSINEPTASGIPGEPFVVTVGEEEEIVTN